MRGCAGRPALLLTLRWPRVVQKYRLYLKRLAGLPPNARLSPELVQGGAHLYPYVHQPHEVPPPMMMPPPPMHQVSYTAAPQGSSHSHIGTAKP